RRRTSPALCIRRTSVDSWRSFFFYRLRGASRIKRVAMKNLRRLIIILLLTISILGTASAQQRPPAPPSVRVYLFDCGFIKAMGVETYGFKPGEVKAKDFFVRCSLIAHPRGILMWDVGVIPDSAFPASGGPAVQGSMSAAKTLKSQMASAGYK